MLFLQKLQTPFEEVEYVLMFENILSEGVCSIDFDDVKFLQNFPQKL